MIIRSPFCFVNCKKYFTYDKEHDKIYNREESENCIRDVITHGLYWRID